MCFIKQSFFLSQILGVSLTVLASNEDPVPLVTKGDVVIGMYFYFLCSKIIVISIENPYCSPVL